ncbi:MAG: sulfite exporter TauE/SafE family protein [Cypionkella sp.]
MLDLSLLQILAVSAAAFLAAIIGGVSGYGTGLLLPPILLPLVGPTAVVPIISLSALVTNATRLFVFREVFDKVTARRVLLCALPGTAAGAYFYTLLTGPAVMAIIGFVLVILVPLRRILMRRHGGLSARGTLAASAGYGIINGGTSGSGVILLTILLSTGLVGSAVIATDAGISIVLGVLKVAVFQSAGLLTSSAVVMAAIIGVSAIPGAFIAKRISTRLSARLHTGLLDAVVILGGILLVIEAIRAASSV